MRVSEKSLELNVGAELLSVLRGRLGMPKAYLRGLTQAEERREGVDIFVQLDPRTRVFAFQFKAPKGDADTCPYRFILRRDQHDLLFGLSRLAPRSTFYVLPFYRTAAKLHADLPDLASDTWLADVSIMRAQDIFGTFQTRTAVCHRGVLAVNPEYALRSLADIRHADDQQIIGAGIPITTFGEWYTEINRRGGFDAYGYQRWLLQGIRLVFVYPDAG